jgi:hypothetical protein
LRPAAFDVERNTDSGDNGDLDDQGGNQYLFERHFTKNLCLFFREA